MFAHTEREDAAKLPRKPQAQLPEGKSRILKTVYMVHPCPETVVSCATPFVNFRYLSDKERIDARVVLHGKCLLLICIYTSVKIGYPWGPEVSQ